MVCYELQGLKEVQPVLQFFLCSERYFQGNNEDLTNLYTVKIPEVWSIGCIWRN